MPFRIISPSSMYSAPLMQSYTATAIGSNITFSPEYGLATLLEACGMILAMGQDHRGDARLDFYKSFLGEAIASPWDLHDLPHLLGLHHAVLQSQEQLGGVPGFTVQPPDMARAFSELADSLPQLPSSAWETLTLLQGQAFNHVGSAGGTLLAGQEGLTHVDSLTSLASPGTDGAEERAGTGAGTLAGTAATGAGIGLNRGLSNTGTSSGTATDLKPTLTSIGFGIGFQPACTLPVGQRSVDDIQQLEDLVGLALAPQGGAGRGEMEEGDKTKILRQLTAESTLLALVADARAFMPTFSFLAFIPVALRLGLEGDWLVRCLGLVSTVGHEGMGGACVPGVLDKCAKTHDFESGGRIKQVCTSVPLLSLSSRRTYFPAYSLTH